LVAIANALKTEIRPSDTLARLGGDEFACIFTDLKQGTEHEICNRMYAAVLETIQQFDLIKLGVNVSIGALVIDVNLPITPKQLMTIADREMYAVKASKDVKIRIGYLSKLKLKYVA
jgi:diguanylate cyclase (GGDEF)-like protein